MRLAALAVCLLLGSCAQRSAGPAVGVTGTPAPEPPPTEPRSGHRAEPPDDVVERAALPISGVRLADGVTLSRQQLFDELSRFDAVCIGESHDDPHHHYAELALAEELARRAQHRGELLGVGFEMFQVPYQGALDGFAQGNLDETTLLIASDYQERWGFPFAFYRPLLELGRERGLIMLALNARRELTRDVARNGVDGVSGELARELPELDLEDPEHRKTFDRLMEGHPKGHGSVDRLYEAQVVWDETMASRAAQFLGAGRPARRLVIVAGLAHCSTAAIPARIERRVHARVASLMPSVGTPAQSSGFDYALVMTPPTG